MTVRMFPEEISIGIGSSEKLMAFPSAVSTIQFIEGQNKTREAVESRFCTVTAEAGVSVSSCPRCCGSETFRLGLESIPSAIWFSGLLTESLALLCLQLTDRRSWDFLYS